MEPAVPAGTEPDLAFEALLDYLKRQRGFDFSGYKPTGLSRRVRKRMAEVGVDGFGDYLDLLQVHPEEFARLFDTLLINVTGFFRDPNAWEALRTEILPRLLAEKPTTQPIRVWSAGCSTGEEAYTLVMLLAEVLGWEEFKARVKVYATDVDEHALAYARAASYTDRETENVPPELRERYFERAGDRWTFRPELRRFVIFGRNDLAQDAPISHLDLLTCRNTLMYFTAEAQGRILSRLHFALRDTGVVLLGKAEMLLTRGNLFIPLDLKNRIFAKVPRADRQERVLALASAMGRAPAEPANADVQLRDAALDAVPMAQIVVDSAGDLALINEQARILFRLRQRDVGAPLKDLEVSYRPLELRSRIDQARAERRPVYVPAVEFQAAGGAVHFLDVQIIPLAYGGKGQRGASICFTDVTRSQAMQTELQHANESLETAYEELQATNKEMETTNEELQSTIEELETTNEELQSTNEELETMNEELQSTDEELGTMNDELRRRTEEFNRLDSLMNSILASFAAAVVVLDGELCVTTLWNGGAEELWGLRAGEAQDRGFAELDIGLPTEPLLAPLRACVGGASEGAELTVPAVNRRGRAFPCRVTISPLRRGERVEGALVVMKAESAAPTDRTETELHSAALP